MISCKPILVTGSPRSGTTWVGRILSQSPSIGYIHEPFNIRKPPCGYKFAQFNYAFTYICKENESNLSDAFKKTLSFEYNVIQEIMRIRSPKDGIRFLRDYTRSFISRHCNLRPLVKDPMALFSSEWLALTFDMDVIVMIRHPAAFVYSIKELKWEFDFKHFLAQPLLMRAYLLPFEDQIKEYAYKKYTLFDKAILLWKIIHHVIKYYQANHEKWSFIRHEDLSRASVEEFRKIFEKINLDFSEKIQNTIEKYSTSKSMFEHYYPHVVKRDSKTVIGKWKKNLTSDEIRKVRTGVEDISKEFYGDEEW